MSAAALPIFMFHALDERGDAIAFPPDGFARLIERLWRAGFRAVGLEDAVTWLRQGTALPSRALVLTFDDGYRSVYEAAFPVLQRFGMTATVFLTVGGFGAAGAERRLPALGGRAMLSWGEIREMRRHAIRFGAHTLTHPDLRRLAPPAMEAEVVGSRAVIEDALGAAVPCFAYPFGRSDARARALARRHFACACADTLGFAGPSSDLYALERVDAYYVRARALLPLATSPLFRWYVRARAVPRALRRAALPG